MAMLVETSRCDQVKSLSVPSSPTRGGRPASARAGHPGAVPVIVAVPEADGGAGEGLQPGPLQAAVLAACTSPDLAPGFTDWLRGVVAHLDDPAS